MVTRKWLSLKYELWVDDRLD